MLLPVVIILIYCNTLALSQFYVPEFPELQMVPVYMPVMPEIPITNTDATHNSDKGKTYYKTFNDKLPGGSGRGHVYEHYAPGHHEYSNSYNSFQSFGDPAGFRKQIFNTPNGQMLTYSNTFGTSYSNSYNTGSLSDLAAAGGSWNPQPIKPVSPLTASNAIFNRNPTKSYESAAGHATVVYKEAAKPTPASFEVDEQNVKHMGDRLPTNNKK